MPQVRTVHDKPGHVQTLPTVTKSYPCSQATPRFYLAAVEKIGADFSPQLRDKIRSSLGNEASCLGRMNGSIVHVLSHLVRVLHFFPGGNDIQGYLCTLLFNSLYTRIPPYSLVNFSKFPVTLHKLRSVLGVSSQIFCPGVGKYHCHP